MKPQQGDKIMMFKPKWKSMILNRTKTMEIRGRQFQKGVYWLGCKKMIHGKVRLGQAKEIKDINQWKMLFPQHRCETDQLPYVNTWSFEILEVETMIPISFEHPRGAVSIVRYKE